MTELSPETEQQLVDMSDDELHALWARIRPPGWHGNTKPGEQAKAQLEKRFGIKAKG
ncbi:hypothetical protein ACWDUN_03990 [Mycobacterium sp. NPDC003323]